MERIEILRKLIKKYATSYYAGQAEVSDEYFDNLVEELRSLNPDDVLLKTPGWGYEPSRKVKHWWDLQIGSLPKVKEGYEIPQKYEHARISAKLDGLSVVSYYVEGRRIQSITRGNGTEGLDVTNKINIIDPDTEYCILNPDKTPFTGAVRGEVVMPMDVWHRVYEPQKAENPSMNPRNIASGLMNRKDNSEELRNLNYVVYKVLHSDGYEYKDMIDQLYFFDKPWTFVDCTTRKIVSDDQLKDVYDTFCERYPCDGLVFSNYEDGDWDEIAYKFQAESVEVKVNRITWNATRTGRLNPLIWFNPVELSGAMVHKCTGFNAAFIRDNKIGPGATIEVCRANEVIPHVMSVVDPLDEIELPEVCPSCGNDIHWDGVDLVCDAENESQLAYHFIATLGSVDGAGGSLYSSIIDTFHLSTLDQLCNFISNLKTSGVQDAMSFIKTKQTITGYVTLQKTEQVLNKLVSPVDPVSFLCACNVPKISRITAESLIRNYPRFIQSCIDGTLVGDKITSIKGLGESVRSSISQFDTRIARLAFVMNFKEVEEKKEAKFKVAITGALSMKRADFDKELQAHGIEQSGNFKEIKYLITNNPDSGSSKMQNAKKYGVEIISEEEFKNKYFN